MHKFSLFETAADLKIKLKITTFAGEASFKPSANIGKGDLIPVLMRNENGEKYLHSMKWGTNIFGDNTRNLKQLTNQARDDKLFRSNSNNIYNPWPDLVEKGQRCVIVAKGFYINHYTDIIDAKYSGKTIREKQPYFVSPYIPSEGQFFYIAGLYRIQQTWRGRKYGAISITRSTENDNDLKGYNQRMPFLLRPKDIHLWLNPDIQISHIFSLKYKIRYNKFQKIGLWIDDNSIKEESKILRSRSEWEFEQNAKRIGMEEDDFPWDLIEQEAIEQNDAKKHGNDYKPLTNWDGLRCKTSTQIQKQQNQMQIQPQAMDHFNNNHNHNNNNIGNDSGFEDEDDRELKQEEYTQTDDGNNKNVRKRKRSRNNEDENGEILEPLNKKQKMNEREKQILPPNELEINIQSEKNHDNDNGNEQKENEENENEPANPYTFEDDSDTSNTDNNYHTKPMRRNSNQSITNQDALRELNSMNDDSMR